MLETAVLQPLFCCCAKLHDALAPKKQLKKLIIRTLWRENIWDLLQLWQRSNQKAQKEHNLVIASEHPWTIWELFFPDFRYIVQIWGKAPGSCSSSPAIEKQFLNVFLTSFSHTTLFHSLNPLSPSDSCRQFFPTPKMPERNCLPTSETLLYLPVAAGLKKPNLRTPLSILTQYPIFFSYYSDHRYFYDEGIYYTEYWSFCHVGILWTDVVIKTI